MKKPAIATKWMGEFQAQLYYDESGIEVIRIYKHATMISEYYASTFLEIGEGESLMLDGGLKIWLKADQVKVLQEFIIEHVVVKFIVDTEHKIKMKVQKDMKERGVI